MLMPRFNHQAAVAVAQEQASELRLRSMKLALAYLVSVINRDKVNMGRQRLQMRRRCLEQFIDDPYCADSPFRIGFEKDRRRLLEAGMPT